MSEQPETKRTPPQGGKYSLSLLNDGEWSRPTLAVCPPGIRRKAFFAGECKRYKRKPGTIKLRAGWPY